MQFLIMHNQMNNFFINKLSRYQCGFRKGFGTQHCLLVMIEKLRKIRDDKRVFAAVFTDLLKAFDCISHELLIAKLNAYRFDIKSLNFILAYFPNRKTKNKDRLQFQWLFEYSFWCSTRFNIRSSSFHDLHRDLHVEYLRDRIC